MLINRVFFTILFAGSFVASNAWSQQVNSNMHAEFDSKFLNNDSGHDVTVDLSNFTQGNPVYSGTYRTDLYVNDQWLGRMPIKFVDSSNNTKQAELCIDPALLKQLNLDYEAIPISSASMQWSKEDCLVPGTLPSDIIFTYYPSEIRLNVSIPQAFMTRFPRGYIDPEFWDNGETTAFVAYNLNHYAIKTDGMNDNDITRLGLDAGANMAGWSLRHSGNLTDDSYSGSHYQGYETYVQHDVDAIRGQFKAGDFYTSGNFFKSTSLRGVQLRTDERMLPVSQRGYAPVVRGIANTNALVTIQQNGHEIYSTTVPPGPFEINDLYATGQSGELFVTVTEADGSVKTFVVPYASVGELLRPGQHRFEVSAGQVRQTNKTTDEYGMQASVQVGLSNAITLNTGTILSKNYQAVAIGNAVMTPIGGFNVTATQAWSKFDHKANQNGQSYAIAYNRNFLQSKTYISLAASRYSSKGYYTWEQAVNDNQLGTDMGQSWRPKSEFMLSAHQALPWTSGHAFVSYNKQNYWNQDQKGRESWYVGYSSMIKNVSFSIAAGNSRDLIDNRWRNEVSINVSIPIGDRIHANAQASKTKDGRTNYSTGLNGSVGEENQFNYGLNAYHNEGSGNIWAGNVQANTPYSRLTGSYSQLPSSKQWSAGASGGIVLHRGGVTMANALGETFAIVHAENAEGARVNRGRNIRLDSQGYAIVPHLAPYEINTISIDPKGLPLDVQLNSTGQQVVPRAKSSVLISLETKVQRSALLQITRPGNQVLPVGASVFDDGVLIGVITGGGRVFTQDLKDKGQMDIFWGDGPGEKCQADYDLESDQVEYLDNDLRSLKLTCF